MAIKTYTNPESKQTFTFDVPENQLFRDTSGKIGLIQNGQVFYTLEAIDYIKQKYGDSITSAARKEERESLGLGHTQGDFEQAMYKDLGIDGEKITELNAFELEQFGLITRGGELGKDKIQTLYSSGAIAETPATGASAMTSSTEGNAASMIGTPASLDPEVIAPTASTTNSLTATSTPNVYTNSKGEKVIQMADGSYYNTDTGQNETNAIVAPVETSTTSTAGTTTKTTKLPSGIIVRDASTGEQWFIDNGTKRKITSPSALTTGAGYVDIDSSHLSDIPEGAAISEKPSFNFKSTQDVQIALNSTGINWSEPRGYQSETPQASVSATASPTTTTTSTTGVNDLTETGTPNVYTNSSGEKVIQMADGSYYNTDTGQSTAGATAGATTSSTEASDAEEIKKRTQEAKDLIKNDPNLTEDMKTLLYAVIDNYPIGVGYDPQEIINTFESVRKDTIDPYFQELTNTAAKQFQQAYDSYEANRKLELESEQMTEEEKIRQEKENLEKSGLTFSGEAVKQLGAESAYTDASTEGQNITTQTLGEGLLQQESNLIASSSMQRYLDQLKNLGIQAEQQLGTQGYYNVGGIGNVNANYATIGGITGTQETQRQSEYAKALTQILESYQVKQEGLTNEPFPYTLPSL